MKRAGRIPEALPEGRPRIFITLSLSACLVLAGCGYRAGTASESLLNKNITGKEAGQGISIPLFKNTTFEPILEKPLTQIFKKTFYRRGWNVQGDSDKSGMILFGRIASFGRGPIALNNVGAAREYRVTIILKVRILHEKEGEALVSKTVEGRADYIARPDAREDRIAKDRAIREAGRGMAEEVASLLQMIVDRQGRRE